MWECLELFRREWIRIADRTDVSKNTFCAAIFLWVHVIGGRYNDIDRAVTCSVGDIYCGKPDAELTNVLRVLLAAKNAMTCGASCGVCSDLQSLRVCGARVRS